MEGSANGRVDDTQRAIPEEVFTPEVFRADGKAKHDNVPFETSVEVEDENSEHMKQIYVPDESNSSDIRPNVESQIIEKSSDVLDPEKLEEVSDSDVNVNYEAPAADSFEPHLFDESTQFVKAPIKHSVSSDVAELVAKEVEERVFLQSSDENTGFSPVLTEKTTEEADLAEDKLLPPNSSENSHMVSDATELESKEVEDSGFSPVVTEKVTEGVNLAEDELLPPNSSENSHVVSDATELESKEAEESVLPSPGENNEYNSPSPTELTSEELNPVETSTLPASDGKIATVESSGEFSSPGAAELTSKELNPVETSTLPASDEKTTNVEQSGLVAPASTENIHNLPQQRAEIPGVQKGNIDGGEQSNESQIPESTEYQPIISVSTLHRTSWRSCCGLFDVLRRSN